MSFFQSLWWVYIPVSSRIQFCNNKIFDRNGDADQDVSTPADLMANISNRKSSTYSERKMFPYAVEDDLCILDRFRITGRGVVYTVKISKGCIIHIGDVLLDLRGNRFEVSGIEMFRGIIAEGKSFEDMPLGLMFKQLDGVEAYGNILVKDLNDINFIFCNHPLYQRKVDEDYEVEYQEAGLHHACALFSYEDTHCIVCSKNSQMLL